MTKTMQKLEQIAYFDRGTLITVVAEDTLYHDAEFVELNHVEIKDTIPKRIVYYWLIKFEDKLISIPENKLKEIKIEL